MYNVKKVNEDLYWIGASDRRLALFENIYPIPRGVSYNSYVILDEQTVLLDTVDKAVSGKKISGSKGCGKCQNLHYDEAVLYL